MMSKLITILMIIFSSSVLTAERKNIFADPQNLKVLPDDISPADLRETMKSFSMGLGVRCSHCHVGEEGKPLSTFEFDKDDKKSKRKARVMLKMLSNINKVQLSPLDEIEKRSGIKVQCITCHRGQQKPEMIEDVLVAEFSAKGIDGLIEKYSSLREKYYGSHTFNFAAEVLPLFVGKHLRQKSNHNDAVKLLEKNIEYFPDSFFGLSSLGSAYQKINENTKARALYAKALKINPKSRFIKNKLKHLDDSEKNSIIE